MQNHFLQQKKDLLLFEFWRRIHELPEPVIRRWQQWRAHRLLVLAWERSSFYRELWTSAGIGKSEIASPGILHRLPVTSKRSFRNKSVETYVVAKPREWRATSGSTGEPFSFPMPDFGPHYENFLAHRLFTWEGISWTEVMNMKLTRIRIIPFQHPVKLVIPVSEFLENPRKVLEAIQKYRGFAIETFPSILYELARLSKDSGYDIHCKYAVTYGEILLPSQRAFIEERLRCVMYDRYGLEELGPIGSECRMHDGFHLNSESYILEILDDDDLPVGEGTSGRVVITSLNNFVMPFIRYDTGDRGRVIPGRCRCGLSAERFQITGRYGSFLECRERRIHHFEIAEVMNQFFGQVVQWQVFQNSLDFFHIDIVPGHLFGPKTPGDISSAMRAIIPPSADFQVNAVNSVQRLSANKIKNIITSRDLHAIS